MKLVLWEFAGCEQTLEIEVAVVSRLRDIHDMARDHLDQKISITKMMKRLDLMPWMVHYISTRIV